MSDFPGVMPHGELHEILPDVFWLQGSVRMSMGMTLNRVMTVLRHEGELTVINSIRPSDPTVLDRIGEVRHVVKIGGHGMDDAWFVDHYGATYWAQTGVEGADRVLAAGGDTPIPDMSVFEFESTVKPELALLVDRAEGVLVTCDSVQNWPDSARCSLLAKVAVYAMGFNARPAQIGPPWRKGQTPEGGTLEGDFRRLIELPFDHIVPGHGAPLMGGAKAALTATVDATF